jgi:hypothetical protein
MLSFILLLLLIVAQFHRELPAFDPIASQLSYIATANNVRATDDSRSLRSKSPEENRSAATDLSTLEWKFLAANFATANAKRVIFLLSMGQEASESTIVERCLLSIRRPAAFLGPVIVLTDAPLSRYASLTSVDPNLIVSQPRLEDWRLDLTDDMPYKRYTIYILEHLDLDVRLK